jgi:peptidoglycan/LPS O-acetylase OafA/YrhL
VRVTVRRNYETLNAMRGVAAIGVLLFHAKTLLGFQLVPRGYLAVDLFFALSGFVIAYAYDHRLRDGLGWRGFGRLRLFRFYPLYALGLAIGLLRELALIATHNDYAFGIAQLGIAFVTAALFIPYPVASRDWNLFSLNVPSWSLFYELLVNIAYAALFPLLRTRVLVVIAVVAGGVTVATIMAAGTADLGATLPQFAGGLARTIFSFSVGLLICRLNIGFPKIALRLLSPVAILVLVGLCLIMPLSWGVGADIMFIFLISPILLIAGASVEPSGTKLRMFAVLGVISFPLYAIHRPVLAIGEAAVRLSGLPAWAIGAALTLGLLAASYVVDRIYDQPVRRWLTRRGSPTKPS